MELRRIKSFVEVADCQSFTRAGGRLAIAQSALSRQIRDLETELGAVLLHRTGRGVQLTDAGRTFLERARKLLSDAEQLVAETKLIENGGGTVHLGVPPSVSQILLPPLINRLRREKPQLRLRVVEGFSGHICEWLLAGRLDLAVLYRSPATATLLADLLLSEDLCLVSPPTSDWARRKTVRLADVATLPLALPSRPHGLRLLLEKACEKSGTAFAVEIEVDAFSTMKELAQSGLAYTVLPICAVAEEMRQGKLAATRIVDPPVSRELVFVSSGQRLHTRAAKDVARMLRQQVSELISTGRWQARIVGAGRPARQPPANVDAGASLVA